MTDDIIEARWDAPARVRAFTTTRSGGISRAPYDSLNLAAHVDDNPESVQENRIRMRQRYRLPAEPVWLNQVHGTHIVRAEKCRPGQEADGSLTYQTGLVCAVLTADCVPLFMCKADGTLVGLFHIGWRGLSEGIVSKAARLFEGRGETLAWLGPAVGPEVFEVDEDVKSKIKEHLNASESAFQPGLLGKWLVNLYALVAEELARFDVACNYDETLCTCSDPDRFFSYRRSRICGRMASVIWIEA